MILQGSFFMAGVSMPCGMGILLPMIGLDRV